MPRDENSAEPSDRLIVLAVICLFAMLILLALVVGMMQDMRYFCN